MTDEQSTNVAPSGGVSQAERQLLALLSEGLPTSAVARRLGVSERTVRRQIRDLCDRIGVSSRVEAIVWATRRGVI